jgi:hypothetical protein
MAFLHNHLSRKILLTLILVWSGLSFYLTNIEALLLAGLIIFISLLGLIFIWTEKSTIFTLILLSFTSTYAFSISMVRLDIPLWLVMIGVVIIFGYLFTYTEQKIGILGNKRLIYLILFSLIVLEAFLALTYFAISPINQSLIISSISYLFVGYCYTILAKHEDNNFLTYVIITTLAILLVFLTSTWGGIV